MRSPLLGKQTSSLVVLHDEARTNEELLCDLAHGSWRKAGLETDVCVMFNDTPPDSWKDLSKDARAYGRAFAKSFGPSSAKSLVSSCEVGNEPIEFDRLLANPAARTCIAHA